MLCGVKFCGGCNPRYDRGKAFQQIRQYFADENTRDGVQINRTGDALRFDFVKEGPFYDCLLVIGGCPACCASYNQYNVTGAVVKMWDETHIEAIIKSLKNNQEK